MYRNAREAGGPITSGSIYDRGTNNPPDFNEWILETKCSLPITQRRILEGLVSSHNSFYNFTFPKKKHL